jgi:hypothetical protein
MLGSGQMNKCSKCSNYDHFHKKQRTLANRGLYALCRGCCQKEQKNGFEFYECAECGVNTNDYDKGVKKRAREGESVTCRNCHAAREAKRQKIRQEERERKEQEEHANRLRQPNPPYHPDQQSRKLKPDATLEVTSGGICFGVRNDCKYAASRPLQSVEEVYEEKSSYTGPTCNSIRARNGTWLAYKIVIDQSECKTPCGTTPDLYPTAWMVCHQDLDPIYECRYLLYHSVETTFGGAEVSGSGYGRGHVRVSHDYLRRLGIIKINRYDWGHSQVAKFSNSDFNRIYKHGYQVVDFGKAQKKNYNCAVSTCLSSMNYGRIHVENDQAKSFLIFEEHTMFQESCFSSLYSNNACPLGHDEGGWVDSVDDHADARAPLPGQQKITHFFAAKTT